MRDSPSRYLIPDLQAAGATVRAYDPEGMREARHLFKDITFATDAYDAMTGADCLVLVTEWNEFRALDVKRVLEKLNSPIIVDLRNIYVPEEMRKAGFQYHSIGRQ